MTTQLYAIEADAEIEVVTAFDKLLALRALAEVHEAAGTDIPPTDIHKILDGVL